MVIGNWVIANCVMFVFLMFCSSSVRASPVNCLDFQLIKKTHRFFMMRVSGEESQLAGP